MRIAHCLELLHNLQHSEVARPRQRPSALVPGESVLEPAPLGSTVVAGPFTITLTNFSMGEAPTSEILAGDPSNPVPEPGVTYALVNAIVKNTGSQTVSVAGDDFAMVGSSGRIWSRQWFDGSHPFASPAGTG